MRLERSFVVAMLDVERMRRDNVEVVGRVSLASMQPLKHGNGK